MDGYQGGMFPNNNQQGGGGRGGGYNQQGGGNNDYYQQQQQQQQQQQPQQGYGQQQQGGYQQYQNNPYQQQQQHYGGGGGGGNYHQQQGGGYQGGAYQQQQQQQPGGYGHQGGYHNNGHHHHHQGGYQGGGGGYQQQHGGYYQQQGGYHGGYGGGYGGRGDYGGRGRGGRGRGGHYPQQRDVQPREERKVNYVVVPVSSVDDVKFIQEVGFYHVDQQMHDEYISGPYMKACTVTLMFAVQESLVGKCVVSSVAKAKSEIPIERAPNIDRLPNTWSNFIFKVKDVSIFNDQVCLFLKDVRLPGVHTLNPLGHGFERFYPLHVVCDANLKALFAALDGKPAHTEPINFETLSADDALKMCQEDVQYMATICAAMYNPDRYPAIIGKSGEGEDTISRPTPEWQGGFLQSALYSFNQAAIDDKNLAVTADGSFHTALILQSCFWGTSLDGHSGLLYYLSRELDAYHNPADPAARPICPVLAQFYGHPLLALSCTFRSIASNPELPLPNRDIRVQLMENFEPAAERCFHSYTCGRVLFALLCEVIGLPEENDPNILGAHGGSRDPTQREKRGRDDEGGPSNGIVLVKATGAVSTTPPAEPPSAGKVEALSKILPVVAKEKILTQGWKHMQTSRMVQQTLPCIMDIIIRNHSALEEAACDIIRHLCVEHLLDVSMDQHGNYLTTAVFENIAARMDLQQGKENSPPAFYQVVILLLEKIASHEGKAMACSKTASNCLDNLLKSFIPLEKNALATSVSPFQEVVLEAFVRLFEMNPDAACDRFGNYTAQKLFDRVAPSPMLVSRVLAINWPERHDMHLGGNCRGKLNALRARVDAEKAAAAALAATTGTDGSGAVPPSAQL